MSYYLRPASLIVIMGMRNLNIKSLGTAIAVVEAM